MEAQIVLLKEFVKACKANPDLLHHPGLDFYRDYLQSLGATIPPKKEEEKPAPPPPKAEEPMETQEEAEPEEQIPYPELDNEGVIPADDGAQLPMGDPNKEVSDEDLEKANAARDQAMEAFSNGDFDKAVEHFTQAIELNPGSAILHARRANALLKLKRPVTAIRDCDKAISINPDSAQGYKFRGRANRLLGKWLEAHNDLATACKLDYDDTANEWLKEVEPNAKKLQQYELAKKRHAEEKELKDRRERVRRAQEANRKAAEEAAKMEADGGDDDEGFAFPGAGAGPGGLPPGPSKYGAFSMAELFSDPEIATALQDPEILPALLEVMQNPANMMKHLGNPKIMKIVQKLQNLKAGAGGAAPGAGGCCGGGPCDDAGDCGGAGGAGGFPKPPPKAPEPDLD